MPVRSIFTVQEARQQKGELSELHHFRIDELLRSRWPRGHGSRCFPTGVFQAPALGFLGPRLPLTTPEPAPRLRVGSSRFFLFLSSAVSSMTSSGLFRFPFQHVARKKKTFPHRTFLLSRDRLRISVGSRRLGYSMSDVFHKSNIGRRFQLTDVNQTNSLM